MLTLKRMCHKRLAFTFLFLSQLTCAGGTPTETAYSRTKATDIRPQTRTQKVALDKHNWNDMVEVEGRVSFVKFFAPWCGHCQAMAPEWEKLGKYLENRPIKGVDLVIGTVDCMNMQAMALCLENRVDGYPSVKLLREGILLENFFFARTYERMKRFLYEKLVDPTKLEPNSIGVYHLDDSTFGRVTEDKENVVIVKFFVPQCYHCRQLNPVWEELAIQFLLEEAEDLKFAEVNCLDPDSSASCDEEAVTTFPTIYTYKDGMVEDIFDGDFELKELENFVWRTVDPDRVELDDGLDDMLKLMTNLGGGSEEDEDDEEEETFEECYCGDPGCDCSDEDYMDEEGDDYEDSDFDDYEDSEYDDYEDEDDDSEDYDYDYDESQEAHDEL